MNKKERNTAIISWFQENMPVAETELRYGNPYQLMVAVMLSAQCTDKRVNLLTPDFFNQFPTLESLANASQEHVFEIIKSCSYPNSKATHLIAAAKQIVEEFGGRLPEDIEALMTLPGIGRKTANVIGSVAFNKQALAVDTHVHRVSARLGLTRGAKTPLETEKQLTANIQPELYAIAHHWLILHGRYVCIARKPKCEACGISAYCRFYSRIRT